MLWALAQRAAEYRREWLRAEAAAKADGGRLRDTGGGVQAFAHWAASRRMLSDAIRTALVGTTEERRAALGEHLLTRASGTLPEPSGGGLLCPWCGRGPNPNTGETIQHDQWPVRYPRTRWHDRCRAAYIEEQEGTAP
ncbi:hypothetical protein Drose_26935 [Dactylosporangium roseum]|uniref:Uncharacterized protein n=1 Tax=Dactylosporangium roseum TaxID=47989 RepID=A0ABY5YZI7_9ACTN|nr:hypothetical protein [Dactylosporangium roseum]UWZ34804.1 hypothetical protein Drose_26935 [Dactylosporangium roseum]